MPWRQAILGARGQVYFGSPSPPTSDPSLAHLFAKRKVFGVFKDLNSSHVNFTVIYLQLR